MPSDFDIIRLVIQCLDGRDDPRPQLSKVADRIGLTPHQCHNVFSRWSGISPTLFLSYLAHSSSKQATIRRKQMARSKDIITMLRFRKINNMKVVLTLRDSYHPSGAQDIQYGFHQTLFGRCLLGVSNHELCWLSFAEENDEESLHPLRVQWPNASLRSKTIYTQRFADLFTHKNSSRTHNTPVLRLCGTAFQLQVWRQLTGIPRGMFTTYGHIAQRIGKPRSARAVGNAIGANPISYFIPCHRVIRDTGEIGGYRWSTETKRALLAWEHAQRSAE